MSSAINEAIKLQVEYLQSSFAKVVVVVPKVFVAEESKTAYLCNCKQTSNPGFCDGTHKKLA